MNVTFVSNYINHHQIPFCEAMVKSLGEGNFTFLQTMRMEKERLDMGWEDLSEDLPYVVRYHDDTKKAEQLLISSDVVLYGWAPTVEKVIEERVRCGYLTFCVSERLYKDGQWKALSPKGQIAKRRAYTRFRESPYYLLSAGAYVASDFSLVGAFPGKKLCWGYFPPLYTYGQTQLSEIKQKVRKKSGRPVTRILWAGRFVDFKHPETALRLAADLKNAGEKFELHIAGGGEREEELKNQAAAQGLNDCVTFHGFLPPQKIRGLMEESQIFVFTSDAGEGWGAVVNEAMNSGCAVVAGTEAGCVPWLITNGVNGLLYTRCDYDQLLSRVRQLLRSDPLCTRLGDMARQTIETIWNADTAAERLVWLCGCLLDGYSLDEIELPARGPISRDPEMKPFLKVPN